MPRLNRKTSTLALALAVTLAVPMSGESTNQGWPRWGGPNGNFQAFSAGDLAKTWPAEGPPKLWSRELGDGYSCVLVSDGRLYTMYRSVRSESDESGAEEVVVCLDATTGKTLWETRYDHKPWSGHVTSRGEGPRSTPLIDGDRLYTIGVAGRMHSLNLSDGKVVWVKELWGENPAGASPPNGFASSPISYGDTVITLLGSEETSVAAFHKKDGSLAWKSEVFANTYSSPQILNVAGQDQVVVFIIDDLVAVDPENGTTLWRHEFGGRGNISMPVFVDDEYLFVSQPSGSRGLRLEREDGKTEVEEIWSTLKIRFSFLTSVVQGDWVYGLSGDRAATFLAAINVKTGEVGWRKRGFSRANLVAVNGQVIIQEEDGKIRLATATPEDLTVHSEVEVLEPMAWTSPTIVGTTMYLRDKTQIMAIDLGRQKKEEKAAAEDGKSPTGNEILKKADAAIKAVDAVSYKITTKSDGGAVGRAPDTEGEGFLRGWENSGPMKFYSHLKTTREDQMIEVEGGGDGENFYIVDHVTKKAYEDMDPWVFGSHVRLLWNTGMLEFVHNAPFDDELNADVAELRGTETINGEDCYEVHVVYSGGAGESITWFFAVGDYLPRRRIQYVAGPAGETGTFTITVSDLVVNPPPNAKLFKLALPEGYEQIDSFAP